jgi:phosphoenolpyruvate carboxykinase (GTP)
VDIWRKEAALTPAFYERFGDHLPAALWAELEALKARLDAAGAESAMVAAE